MLTGVWALPDRSRFCLLTVEREHHQRLRIFARVFLVLLVELLGNVVDHAARPVESTEHHVTVGGEHAEVRRRITDDRHVERAAAEVVDHDGLFLRGEVLPSQFAFLPGVGQRRGGRLVDNVNDIQARDLAGVLGCFAADVVEIVRDRDHGVDDGSRSRCFPRLQLSGPLPRPASASSGSGRR